MNFYLIDDDLDDQEFFMLALEYINPLIKCHFAKDGHEAIKHLSRNDMVPDLFFLDMRMPRMSGSECIRELRKIERLQKVPTILYSTSDLEFGNKEATRVGADHFFTKATSIPELTKTLGSVIEKFSKATL